MIIITYRDYTESIPVYLALTSCHKLYEVTNDDRRIPVITFS